MELSAWTLPRDVRAGWRLGARSRRAKSGDIHGGFARACQIFCQNASDTFLMAGAEIYKLESTCTSAVLRAPAEVAFREWLHRHEGIQVVAGASTALIYYAYHQSRLQRLYIRAVLNRIRPAVYAGGAAASTWCRQQGIASWKSNDVDLFLFFDDDISLAIDLYRDIVARNLQARVRIGTWSTSDGVDDVDCEAVTSNPSRAVSRSGLPASRTRVESLRISASTSQRGRLRRDVSFNGQTSRERTAPPCSWNRDHLQKGIEAWVSAASRRFLAKDALTGGPTDLRSQFEQLAKTAMHLPRQLVLPPTYVVYTKKMSLQMPVMPDRGATDLAPINLIRLQHRVVPGNISEFRAHDWSKLVCENFDLSLCSVAIARLEDDLSIREDAFTSWRGAFGALESRKLVFNDAAFACDSVSVHRQMMRVEKYVRRQFTW